MRETKAVLFDLDGTLVDSLEDLGESMNAVLKQNGFPIHPIEAYQKFIGDGVKKLVERALPHSKNLPDSLEFYVSAMREKYATHWNVNTVLYPGISELLDALTQMNIPLSVLSNKDDSFTQTIVKTLFKKWTFAHIQGALPNIPIKPDPTGANSISKKLNISPSRFFYLGDMKVDIETAVRAKMIPVGVTWGWGQKNDLLKAGARCLLNKPTELMGFLNSE